MGFHFRDFMAFQVLFINPKSVCYMNQLTAIQEDIRPNLNDLVAIKEGEHMLVNICTRPADLAAKEVKDPR